MFRTFLFNSRAPLLRFPEASLYAQLPYSTLPIVAKKRGRPKKIRAVDEIKVAEPREKRGPYKKTLEAKKPPTKQKKVLASHQKLARKKQTNEFKPSRLIDSSSAGAISEYLHDAFTSPGAHKRPNADNKRVNIVSKELCDDILERMKPSLLKHAGCDIIDINPGAGIWSSAIHNLLQPRNHYLMEPDHEVYSPLLQPLTEKEGSTYKLIPKSGAVWSQLNSLLSPDYLPQQTEYKPGDVRLGESNDTLLVIANLGWYPRKPYRAFPSVSLLVVHQLLSAVRANSLFNQYGLVRMLVWLGNDEGKLVLPRMVHVRRKMAIEAEISCSEIHEIASSILSGSSWKRDEDLNLESSRRVMKKMEMSGIATPEGRENHHQLQATKDKKVQDSEVKSPTVPGGWKEELQELQRDFAAGKFAGYEEVEAAGSEQERERKTSNHVPNPDWRRLRTLALWMKKCDEDGKTIRAHSPRLADYRRLEARFRAGQLLRTIDPDELKKRKQTLRKKRVKQEKQVGSPLTLEWKRLRALRWWFQVRTKQGKSKRQATVKRLQEMEARLLSGEIKKYSDPALNVDLVGDEIEDITSYESDDHPPQDELTGEEMKEAGTARVSKYIVPTKTEKFARMRVLEHRLGSAQKGIEKTSPLFAELDAILEMQKTVQRMKGPEAEDLRRKIEERTAAFNEEIENLGNASASIQHRLDNYRTFRNEPPLLYWDRREAEPLQVKSNEFYPNHELCLLDFHPAPLWPVLRQDFPANYDVFEYILSSIFMTPSQSIASALKGLTPGAFEWLEAECPSLKDVNKGGDQDLNSLSARCLTQEMLKEIMEAWMRWPFRPDRFELIKKSGSTNFDPDEEENQNQMI